MKPKHKLFSAKLRMALIAILMLAGSVSATAQTQSVIYRFKDPSDGSNPAGGLISDSAGNFYGTTCNGGPGGYAGNGTVFELTQQGGKWIKTSIDAFSEGSSRCPEENLTFDQAGNLYGATVSGGTNDLGTVFRLTPQGNTWTFSLIYSFQGGAADGEYPEGGLVFDKTGNLFGATIRGGNSSCQDGCGTVFQLTPSQGGNWTETVIHFFGHGNDGATPFASPIVDDKGNLFGTTHAGGTAGDGTVFKLDAPATQGGAWTEHVLHNFQGAPDGDGPNALIFDPKGNLDGTTTLGGTANGTIFQLTRGKDGAWTESVLYSFCSQSNCPGGDGTGPSGGLAFDRTGKLYGTTESGGSGGFCQGEYNCGTVFELAPPTTQGGAWTETVLYNFTNGKDGWGPEAGLILGKFGVLYGTTTKGGNEGKNCTFNVGCGTVFKVKP